MSEMPGVGGYIANLQRPIQKRKERESSSALSPVQPAVKRALGGRTSAPVRFSGIAYSLGNAISSLSPGSKLQNFFLATSKEGSTALLLPESSVVVGRSITSYKRDGWLELQERLPEELAVAAIWLFGVDKLRHLFEKQIKPKVFKNFNHLSTDIAWDRAWGKTTSVDLSPQEMFTKNSQEINALLKLKSVRWLFSVGLALAGVAYFIPKANQWKTNLILKHLNRRKRETEGSNVQFGDPNAQNQAAAQSRTGMTSQIQPGIRTPQQPFATGFNPGINRTQQPYTIANTATPTTTNHQTSQPFRSSTPYRSNQYRVSPKFQGGNNSKAQASQGKGQQKNQGPQFGGLPGGSLIQGLGHLVEQTPYGSILVVDAGIAGGRAYVASKRSLFETAEVLFRDIGSLYFYILCAPHLMKLMGAGLDKAFGTSMGLQPKVADKIHQSILDAAKKRKAPITPDFVEKVLKGATGQLADTLMSPEGVLKREMRNAPKATFKELLKKEIEVYTKSSNIPEAMLRELSDEAINTEQIQKILTAIKNRDDVFAKLSSQERQNLTTAIKQAFRHSVGIPVELRKEAVQDHPVFKKLFSQLPKQEADDLAGRILHAAELDGMNQTHSVLRRSINIMQDVLGERQSELLKHGTALADWMDEAVNRHMTLEEMLKHKPFGSGKASQSARDIQTQVQTFMENILAKTGKDTAEASLINHYKDFITDMTRHKQGRLFSLAIDQQDATLAQKLRAMLKGGLENDHQFLNKALEIVGQLETDSRKFINGDKAAKMQEGITQYSDALLNRLRSLEGKTVTRNLKNELQRFFKLNQNLHYGAWTVALGGTMLCLGWLVPHLQTVLTKRLTGHDKHPGIASVDKGSDASSSKPPAKKLAMPSFPGWPAAPYNTATHFANRSNNGYQPFPFRPVNPGSSYQRA
jgi:ribosomal protein L17